jgi:hypothetical protein
MRRSILARVKFLSRLFSNVSNDTVDQGKGFGHLIINADEVFGTHTPTQ